MLAKKYLGEPRGLPRQIIVILFYPHISIFISFQFNNWYCKAELVLNLLQIIVLSIHAFSFVAMAHL